MGIGVEEAVFQQLLQAAVHANLHHVVRIDAEFANGLQIGEFHPINPFHGQHPSTRRLAMNGRDGNSGVVAMQLSEAFGVGGFIEVIHLLEHPFAQFIDQGDEIASDQADIAVQPGGDVAHDVQIQGDLFA